jgi:hypothetical protein
MVWERLDLADDETFVLVRYEDWRNPHETRRDICGKALVYWLRGKWNPKITGKHRALMAQCDEIQDL